MVVWIYNPFDDLPGEGRALRFWTLAHEMGCLGHDVVWWSSTFSHRRKVCREEPVDVTQLNFSIRLVACPPYGRNISLGRVRNHFVWGKQLIRDGIGAIETGELKAPDLILASMPPMEGPIAALEIKHRYGCCVVTDIMDAWPRTLLQAAPFGRLGRTLGGLMLYPYWRMLRKSLFGSDALSAQSKQFADFAIEHGWSGEAHVCYLGANAPQSDFLDQRPQSNSLRLVYIGSMGRSYDLETLIDAVRWIIEKKGSVVELHIAGEGEKLAKLVRRAKGLEQVHFHGFLQNDELGALLCCCDVGVIPMFPDSVVAVPYKAADYLAHGLPVINALPGELSMMLSEWECGIDYTAGDLRSMVSAIETYVAIEARAFSDQKRAASELFRRCFNREESYPAFASWLSGIAAQ